MTNPLNYPISTSPSVPMTRTENFLRSVAGGVTTPPVLTLGRELCLSRSTAMPALDGQALACKDALIFFLTLLMCVVLKIV
jgi:hypothetical protein